MDGGPRIDVRLVGRVRSHLESAEMLAIEIGDEDEVLDFLARLSMADVEAILREALEEDDLIRLLHIVEHRKGFLEDHELPASEARDRADLMASLRRLAKDRALASEVATTTVWRDLPNGRRFSRVFTLTVQ